MSDPLGTIAKLTQSMKVRSFSTLEQFQEAATVLLGECHRLCGENDRAKSEFDCVVRSYSLLAKVIGVASQPSFANFSEQIFSRVSFFTEFFQDVTSIYPGWTHQQVYSHFREFRDLEDKMNSLLGIALDEGLFTEVVEILQNFRLLQKDFGNSSTALIFNTLQAEHRFVSELHNTQGACDLPTLRDNILFKLTDKLKSLSIDQGEGMDVSLHEQSFMSPKLEPLSDSNLMREMKTTLSTEREKFCQLETVLHQVKSELASQKAENATLRLSVKHSTTSESDSNSSDQNDDTASVHMLASFKHAPIPLFTGTRKENISNWIFLVAHIEAAGVKEEVQVLMAVGYLRDLPLHLYRRLNTQAISDGKKVTWAELKAVLMKQFQLADPQLMLRDELLNLKQKGNNYDDYLHDFTMLINQIDDMSENDQLTMFKNGLSRRTLDALKLQQPSTLQEAMRVAGLHESQYQRTSFASGEVQRSEQRSSPNGFRPQRFGHNSSNANNHNNNSYNNSGHKFDKSTITCYKCNKRGHLSNECRSNNNYQSGTTRGSGDQKYNSKNNNNNNNNNNTNNNNNNNRNGIKPKAFISQVNTPTRYAPLVSTSARLNDWTSQLILDTAANVSVLAQHFVIKHKIPRRETTTRLQIASSAPAELAHETEKLRVEIHGTVVYMTFVIKDIPSNVNGLLGLDWLKHSCSYVDTTDRVLVFKKREISLEDPNFQIDDNECYMVDGDGLEEDLIDHEQTWDDKLDVSNDDIFDSLRFDNLSTRDGGRLISLLREYKPQFATNYFELGCGNVAKHLINVSSERPIFQVPYRKSQFERDKINDEINKMLSANIIRPSRSPWSSPVVMIHKKDGSWRFCVDYRKLNAITEQDKFPLPRIDDILDRLQGSKWFTAIDLKSGYWQIPLHESAIDKTAFSTPDGHYEFLRLPFGLRNAPADFSRIMYQTFNDFKFVEIYLDDITIHSATIDEHINHIKQVLARLTEVNLKLNFAKCTWAQSELKVLGHIVSQDSIGMDPIKIIAVRDMKPPTNIKECQRFIGFGSYYRKFIQGFADIAAPLMNLLKKDTEWRWTKECQHAFELIREKLVHYPILRQPNPRKPFILYTDASTVAVGAILSQQDEEGNEYVCSYASRLLHGAEVHYGITEKECLAILWGIKTYRIYLYGAPFKVVTDHTALAWLMSISEPTGRLARWSLYLQTFDFEVVYRRGIKHTNVDILSRPVMMAETRAAKRLQVNRSTDNSSDDSQNSQVSDDLNEDDLASDQEPLINNNDGTIDSDSNEETSPYTSTSMVDDDEPSSKMLDPFDNDALMYYLKFGQHRPGRGKNQIKRVDKLAQLYALRNGILWYIKATVELEVPVRIRRRDLVNEAHLLGHFQIDTTIKRLRERYFWPKMRDDVEFVLKHCLVCKRHQLQAVHEHPALALPVTGIFDRVAIDLVFGLPETTDGYRGIMVITEYLSKFPYAVPIRSKTAVEIAEKLFMYISIFGPPKELSSDQGKEFLNKVVDHLSRISGIERRVTSPYHPRTNGLVERFNQTLVGALRKHAEDTPNNWHAWLPYVLLAYRTRVHSTTNFTPFELIFGRTMNHFENWTTTNTDSETVELTNRALEIGNLVQNTQSSTISTIQQRQETQKKIQDQREHPVYDSLGVGTTVYIRSLKLQGKLEPKYHGPFTVTGRTNNGNYKLQSNKGITMSQSYPLSRLKLVEPEDKDEPLKIEKILDHRRRFGKLEYFVKWYNFPIEDCSWVKEADFDSTELIEEFWNQLSNPEPNAMLCYATSTRLNWYKMWLLTCMIILGMASQADAIVEQPYPKLTGKFKFCDTTDKVLLSTVPQCQIPTIMDPYPRVTWHILEKLKHPIQGTAYVCEVSVIHATFTYTFTGIKIPKRVEYPVPMDRRTCETLIQSRKCGSHTMSCIGDICEYHQEPEPEYTWWNTNTKVVLKCKTYSSKIIADTVQQEVALGTIGVCLVKDFQCKLPHGFMFWSKDVVHVCPYEYIASARFEQRGNILFTNEADTNGTLRPFNNNTDQSLKYMAFELISNAFQVCSNVSIYQTSEGNYVSRDSTVTKWDQIRESPDKLRHLVIADYDYHRYLDYLQRLQDNSMAMKALCYTQHLILRHSFVPNGTITYMLDWQQRELPIYNSEGSLFVPKCYDISYFYIIPRHEFCYEDVPILMPYLMKQKWYNVTAFLTTTGFIKRQSTRILCTNNNVIINLLDRYLIQMTDKATKVTLLTLKQVYRFRKLSYTYGKFDLHHDSRLADSIAYFNLPTSSQHKLVQDTSYLFDLVADNHIDESEKVQPTFHGISYSSYYDYIYKTSLTTIISVIIALFIIIGLYYLLKRVRSNSYRRRFDDWLAATRADGHRFWNRWTTTSTAQQPVSVNLTAPEPFVQL